ncbi:hypothetical protein like AT1G74940 [Hibiscus trionum]|uniref:FLZ-type domain-containing protein n=1 Tax=Hibiscus trionum TaxID=183268 RepID=A0A9W7I6P4_HIBTR|nr:hypothetical protein like AT1G74940 [Hibiscus trionum]
MLGKKSRPVVGKFSDLLIPRNKPSFFNPRIPSDLPKTSKRYDICGVGLGIVAALEKSTFTGCCNRAICSSNLNPSTKVYYNGDEQRKNNNGSDNFNPETRFSEDDVVYSTSDFLSFCHLCRKNLHGKDIYMYRGETGFCSAECRSRQIMMDERKEHYRSKASSSAKFSTSPYNNADQIFSTGILAI